MTERIYRVTCLTPVHVGSGEELARDLDFIADGTRTFLIDFDRLIERSGGGRDVADLIARGNARLSDIIRDQRIPLEDVARGNPIPGAIAADKIRAALWSADGRPYLPGSSFKGSIRTLLLTGFVSGGVPHGPRTTAAALAFSEILRPGVRERERQSRLDELFFRARKLDDPKGDVLKRLCVSDCFFPPDRVEVRSSRAVGTTRNTLTAVETIRSDSVGVLRVSIDDSTLLDVLEFPNGLPAFAEVARWSRTHAAHLLRGDLAYFRSQRNCSPLVDRCDGILTKVSAADGETVFLRLGWGTGWRTMTGDLLTDDERRTVISRVNKTRKVLLANHRNEGDPDDVLGWVRLDPIKAREAAALAVAPLEHIAPVLPEVAAAKRDAASVESAPAPRPATDPFLNRLRKLQARDYGSLSQIVAECGSGATEERKEERLGVLAARLKELFGKDKAKLKSIRERFKDLAERL
jgi:CRISPR-associated protein Csm5